MLRRVLRKELVAGPAEALANLKRAVEAG